MDAEISVVFNLVEAIIYFVIPLTCMTVPLTNFQNMTYAFHMLVSKA